MARDISSLREDSKEDETSNILTTNTAPNSKTKANLERNKSIKNIAMSQREQLRINKIRKREHQSLNKKAHAFGKSLVDNKHWSQAAALRLDNHNDIRDLNVLVNDLDSCHKSKMGDIRNRVKQMENTQRGGRKTRKNKRGRRRQKTRKRHR